MDKESLLFICLGNICRSPAAEAVMRKKLKEAGTGFDCITVDSAAIGPWHEGELPDKRMRKAGAKRGYEVNSVARQIRREDFSKFTYIIGMDHENMKALNNLAESDEERDKLLCAADFMTRHPQYKTVPDPYYGGESDFELALDLIEDACDGIIEQITKKHL